MVAKTNHVVQQFLSVRNRFFEKKVLLCSYRVARFRLQISDLAQLNIAYNGVHHPPSGAVFPARRSTAKGVATLNDTSSESSRRDAYNADFFFGTDTIPAVEISTMANRPRGVIRICIYTVASGRTPYILDSLTGFWNSLRDTCYDRAAPYLTPKNDFKIIIRGLPDGLLL